ncbi:MAG TPA: XRE family transcriptional regulator, partial [Ktedonobacterales bacterium]|nr:XRE family transcriptional regulator [Ktedonobacterales bacterium]
QNSEPTTKNVSMVTLGRESRGLSQNQLAQKLHINQGYLSKVEAGLLSVSDELLVRLSHELNYPPHFFSQEGGPIGVGVTEVFHRMQKDVPKKHLDMVYAQLDLRLRHIRALLRAVDIRCQVPHLDVDEYDGHVEDIARLVRAIWQLPRGPIDDLTQTLEDAGVLVVPFDFGTKHIDAMSRWLPGLPPVFFVNPTSPKDRLRLTTAHELGHMVMHTLPHPEMEQQANRFAAEFLMPEWEIRPDLIRVTLPKLAVLKRYWKTSMNALLKRAETLGAITANQVRYLWAQMGSAGYRTQEPIELDVGGEVPTLLRELVEAHLNDLDYSPADLAQLIPLNKDELWEVYLKPLNQSSMYVVEQSLKPLEDTSNEDERQPIRFR